MRAIRRFEKALARPAQGEFCEDELDGLPEPVARFFRGAIAPGTPLAQTARIAMRGRIRLTKWMRFAGSELLTPSAGFVWSVRAGPIAGYDRYAQGEGEMRWKLLGLVPIVRARGPDISRSAVGRAAGEGDWVPTALLPRYGVRWEAIDDTCLVRNQTLNGYELQCRHILDDQGHVVSTSFERWGDPDSTGSYAFHPFGVEATAHRTLAGLTIPARGRAGWHFGTDRWPDGVFFEYEITDIRLHR